MGKTNQVRNAKRFSKRLERGATFALIFSIAMPGSFTPREASAYEAPRDREDAPGTTPREPRTPRTTFPNPRSDAPAAPPVAGGAGLSHLNGVEKICRAVRQTQAGEMIDADGHAITFTKAGECENLPRRARLAPNCQTTLAELTRGNKTIDEVCSSGRGSMNQGAQAFCTLRQASANGQMTQYCQAYESADRAQTGVTLVGTLDAAAAAACWAEYLTMKAAQAAGGSSAGSLGNLGVCGGAAMAASVTELVKTSDVLFGKSKDGAGNKITDENGSSIGKHSGGALRIDSEDKAVVRGNLTKVLEIAMSAGLSMKGLQIGLCYYGAGSMPGLCGGMKGYNELAGGREAGGMNSRNRNDLAAKSGDYANAKLSQDLAQGRMNGAGTDPTKANDSVEARADLDATNTRLTNAENATADKAKLDAAYGARAELAKQAAIIFTGLTAMRAVSLVSATTTKKKAEELISSQYESWFSTGTTFGTSGIAATGTNIYAPGTGNTFTPGETTNQPNRNGAIAGGSPESFMLPPGSPQNAAANRVANSIPRRSLEAAAVGGAAGMGALVASAASGMGAKDTSAIRAAMSSAFANLPKDSGEYGSGSGGRSLASKGGDTAPELNLKGLFGGDKEEHASAAGDLAYRGPASDDIWHSLNPRGNNLFQIVSEKYDHVQRKRDLAP